MRAILVLCFASLISGHATANIVVDKSNVDEKDYIYDHHQCSELASQAKLEQAGGGMVSGAAKGAAVGAAAGAISGGSGTSGAQTGAAIGLAGGFLQRNSDKRNNKKAHEEEQKLIMRNCMTNRGYTVLN
ncbi:glycine zipper family protein [Shewanella waksmanii]|uniref:glycine zipper family protein n=1 Tax=Shewanella waksmanii TaxID=213783 RepID=UPI00373576C2